jgi:hypothetical protein
MTKDQIKALAKREFDALRRKAMMHAAAGNVRQDELAFVTSLIDERAEEIEEA